MKLLVLANSDIHANYALNLLLPRLRDHEVRLWMSSRVGGQSSTKEDHPTLQTLRFLEQTLFNELIFPAMTARIDTALSSFSGFSRYLAEAPQVRNDINSDVCLAKLADLAPDLIVSIRYGTILHPAAINTPRLGVLNLHSGKLPDYRGVMATFWAMLSGEERIGTSLHWIQDSGIDTGDIIGMTDRALSPSRSYLDNVLDLYPDGCNLVAETVTKLAAGDSLPTRKPQRRQGRYYSFPDAAAMDRFVQSGFRLYDETKVVELAKRYLNR